MNRYGGRYALWLDPEQARANLAASQRLTARLRSERAAAYREFDRRIEQRPEGSRIWSLQERLDYAAALRTTEDLLRDAAGGLLANGRGRFADDWRHSAFGRLL